MIIHIPEISFSDRLHWVFILNEQNIDRLHLWPCCVKSYVSLCSLAFCSTAYTYLHMSEKLQSLQTGTSADRIVWMAVMILSFRLWSLMGLVIYTLSLPVHPEKIPMVWGWRSGGLENVHSNQPVSCTVKNAIRPGTW